MVNILNYCDTNFNNDTQEIARVQLIELFKFQKDWKIWLMKK